MVSALVSSVSSSAIWTTGCSGSPCSTYHVMSRAASQTYSLALAKAEEASELVGVARLRRRAQHPGLELVVQLIAARLERADLGGERAVVEQQRRVGEADRRLRQVLHLHQDVDGTIELREQRACRRRVPRASAARRRARAPGSRPSSGPRISSTSPTADHVVGSRVELPVETAADRHDPHARSRWAGRARAGTGRRPAPGRGPSPGRSSRRRGAGRGGARRGCRGGPRPRARCRRPRRRSVSIASAIHSTPAMPSASSGERAGEHRHDPQAAEVVVHPLSRRPTSRASFSSLKNTAA